MILGLPVDNIKVIEDFINKKSQYIVINGIESNTCILIAHGSDDGYLLFNNELVTLKSMIEKLKQYLIKRYHSLKEIYIICCYNYYQPEYMEIDDIKIIPVIKSKYPINMSIDYNKSIIIFETKETEEEFDAINKYNV